MADTPETSAPSDEVIETPNADDGPKHAPSQAESRRGFLEMVGGSLAKFFPGGERVMAEAAAEKNAAEEAAKPPAESSEETPAVASPADSERDAQIAALQAEIAALKAPPVEEPPEEPPEDLSPWQLKVVSDFGEDMGAEDRDFVAALYSKRAQYEEAKVAYAAAEDGAEKVTQVEAYLSTIDEKIRRERRDYEKNREIATLRVELEAIKAGEPKQFEVAPHVTKALDAVVGDLADKLPRVAHALSDPERRKQFETRMGTVKAETETQFFAMAENILLDMEAMLPDPPPAKPEPKDPIEPSASRPAFRKALKTDKAAVKPMSAQESRRAFFNTYRTLN